MNVDQYINKLGSEKLITKLTDFKGAEVYIITEIHDCGDSYFRTIYNKHVQEDASLSYLLYAHERYLEDEE